MTVMERVRRALMRRTKPELMLMLAELSGAELGELLLEAYREDGQQLLERLADFD